MKFKSDQTEDKLRGGYYTPQHLANYVAQWVASDIDENATILEPSCGDGVFFRALSTTSFSKTNKLLGFELLKEEGDKSRALCQELGFKNFEIHNADFLSWANEKIKTEDFKVSGIVGNPPFIRYQFLEKEFQKQAELVFKQLDLKFTKHTNAWVSFVLASLNILEDGGKLGMIIPSEIIHVTHSRPLREYLEKVCSKVLIIDPQEIWFDNTLQGAVIICAEKKKNPDEKFKGIGIQQVSGLNFLKMSPEKLYEKTNRIKDKTSDGKWTKGLLKKSEWKLIEEASKHKDVHRFIDIATVDVGIVTGANAFFLVNSTTVKQYDLYDYTLPMFGRSQHCKGVIYDESQHEENNNEGLPSNFLYIKEDFEELPFKVQEYIKTGQEQNLHTRYKCRIREPWYKVPSIYATNLGMLKRCHNFPRLIYNKIQAYTTDTAYRITSQIEPEILAYCFINPLTAIYAELEGRSYGGGVLELVPSEIAKLYIPININSYDIKTLNENIKSGQLSPIEIMSDNGYKVLEPLGFSKDEVDALVTIWVKLKDRRLRK